MNWIKQQAANIAGTAEPEYGPNAIQSVNAQPKQYTDLTNDHLKWKGMESTCVETASFYFMNDDGQQTMAQIIYSNVAGIKTTCQFNSKIFHHDGPNKNLWCSEPVHNHKFDASGTGFLSDHATLTQSPDGNSYSIKSDSSPENIVDITVTRAAPGFVAGEDGISRYGTDPKKPWGSMYHAFWPFCKAQGTMKTKTKTYEIKGRAVFIFALQAMKPHHAAAKWNFVNLQTPTYSAVMMEFTTPPSYGRTVVNVGSIAKEGEIVYAGSATKLTPLAVVEDKDVGWPEPKALLAEWNKAGPGASFEIQMDLGDRVDRVDVLSHVPSIIKNLIGGVVGTKPFIYQFLSKDKQQLKIKTDEEEKSETGQLFYEATFIT